MTEHYQDIQIKKKKISILVIVSARTVTYKSLVACWNAYLLTQ